MNFNQAIVSCFKNYAGFSGRASRSEFWWFTLFQAVVLIAASIFSMTLYSVAALVMLLPSVAVSVRRLHDIGRSGWWQLLILTGPFVLILFYWWVQPSLDQSG